jgi:IKAROS family zinc finger protein
MFPLLDNLNIEPTDSKEPQDYDMKSSSKNIICDKPTINLAPMAAKGESVSLKDLLLRKRPKFELQLPGHSLLFNRMNVVPNGDFYQNSLHVQAKCDVIRESSKEVETKIKREPICKIENFFNQLPNGPLELVNDVITTISTDTHKSIVSVSGASSAGSNSGRRKRKPIHIDLDCRNGDDSLNSMSNSTETTKRKTYTGGTNNNMAPDVSASLQENPNDKSIQCEILKSQTISTENAFENLQSKCTNIGQDGCHECEHCGIVFNDEVLHSVHMGCHSLTDPYRCNVCGKCCKDKYAFYIHIMRGHVIS